MSIALISNLKEFETFLV